MIDEILDKWINGKFREENTDWFYMGDSHRSLWFLMLFSDLAINTNITWDQFSQCDQAARGHTDYYQKMVRYVQEVLDKGELSWESRTL